MRVYKISDLEGNLLEKARVAVLGYGNQGRAHALNLRDSGVEVIVGARKAGAGWLRAREDDFCPVEMREAVRVSDVVVLLVPDEVQREVFENEVSIVLGAHATLVFAHGFSVAFGEIEIPSGRDVILVAPKGQGDYLRELYRRGEGLPCLVAVERDESGLAMQRALSYASLIGCLRAGAIETSFKEEAVTDLFGEQVVLCGGVPALVKAAFEVLVENGYDPHIAYLECLHELKVIADLMQQGGIAYMKGMISKTAAWGSFTAGGKIVSRDLQARMREILEEIESGAFARAWIEEAVGGKGRLSAYITGDASHPIEEIGRRVRALMPYLKSLEG